MKEYSYDDVDIAMRTAQWQHAVVRRLSLLRERNALSDTLAGESDYVRHAGNAEGLWDSIRVLEDLLKSLEIVAVELGEAERTIAASAPGHG